MRNCDDFQVTKRDVEKILDWENNQALQDGVEVAFKPARVILQVKIKILAFIQQCIRNIIILYNCIICYTNTYCYIANRTLLECQQLWILLQ